MRRFRSDPVPQDVLDEELEVARWSGSASSLHPWKIVMIQDREALKALGEVRGYANHLVNAPF